MKPLILAPRIDGSKPPAIAPDHRHIVIVGANGAGKTRFAEAVAADCPGAFRVSALQAIYSNTYSDTNPGSIDSLFAAEIGNTTAAATQAERLTALFMHREMTTLLAAKLGMEHHGASPLDSLIDLWHEIFPDNKILIEAGRLLISSPGHGESRPEVRLSAGERAVLFLLQAAIIAPRKSTFFVESPEIFLHPSLVEPLWSRIEALRPDCRFVFVTHSLDFATTRTPAPMVWVKAFNPAQLLWDYSIMTASQDIPEPVYNAILGARKPVLFIEGDGVNSIDAKLYPLIFIDHNVRSLGSCNKVIEATRTFNDLNALHHLASYGIVDRDRRDEGEVAYLRAKHIMVPEVAEIENILMLEDVIRAVAEYKGKNPTRVFLKVKRSIMRLFANDLHAQALLHTRHRVKRIVACRIDGRFSSINMLEDHLRALPAEINPRGLYDSLCKEFHHYLSSDNYTAVLKVYNQKSMLPASNVASLCGLRDKKEYISTIINILSHPGPQADMIRHAVTQCFGLGDMKQLCSPKPQK